MMTTTAMSVAIPTDADLVGETLSGNRDAFSRIVTRYQSLICSLAYSATGGLGQSEDLAQETFITAWKHLGQAMYYWEVVFSGSQFSVASDA